MEITQVTIKRVVPKDGLIGFASFVLDNKLFFGNIGVFSRLNKDTYRLIFPEKRINNKSVPLFHPITKEYYFELEEIINEELKKQAEIQ